MSDNVEWDGEPIDGTDQYITDAPYWSDGETIGPDRDTADADGDVSVDADAGDDPNEGDGRTWPPTPDDIDEIRQRLLDGESMADIAHELPVSDASIWQVVRANMYESVSERASIPPLTFDGSGSEGEWVVADDESDQETDGERRWPPTADELDEIRQRLLDGESAVEIADELPVTRFPLGEIARGCKHTDISERANTPPLKYVGNPPHGEWFVDDDDLDLDAVRDERWPPSPEELDEIRQRLLDGGKIADITNDWQLSRTPIRNIVRGRTHTDISERASTPPLTFDSSGPEGEWVVADDEFDQETDDDEDEHAAEPTTSSDPETDAVDEPEPISDRALGAAVLAVAVTIAYLLGRRGGS